MPHGELSIDCEPETWFNNFSVTWMGVPIRACIVAKVLRRSCSTQFLMLESSSSAALLLLQPLNG
jgi:hypothetical protein